jgi:hypothetical protein
MKINLLKVGSRVRYTSSDKTWIWEGRVLRVTWKFAYIRWTHSNTPWTHDIPMEGGKLGKSRTPWHSIFARKTEDAQLSLLIP